METTLGKIASCRYKTKMDKRSGFWQVDLTPNAQELLDSGEGVQVEGHTLWRGYCTSSFSTADE